MEVKDQKVNSAKAGLPFCVSLGILFIEDSGQSSINHSMYNKGQKWPDWVVVWSQIHILI